MSRMNEIFMSKQILVTGCAGFIPSRVAEILLEQGHRVVGIDNLNDYYDLSLKMYRLEKLLTTNGFEFQKLDLEDQPGIKELFDKYDFDCVFNLAGRAGVRHSIANPHLYLATNSVGNVTILEEMRKRNIKKYVFASSSSVYGGQNLPFKEDEGGNFPLSPYAASKKAAEVMAHSYHYLYDIDVSICRYFTVYGPGSRPDMGMFRFIKWINEGIPIELFGDGSQSRDFTFVDDIARGTIAASQLSGYEIINLGGNKPIQLMSIINKLETLLGKKALINRRPAHKADCEITWADTSKAEKLLGWTPSISIDQGLEKCVQWHRENLPWSSTIKTGLEKTPLAIPA